TSQLHASSASSGLVAGYHDPQLGYIELKAHLGSDGVHASIAAATPEVSSILAGHVPALHQWLHERQTPVETLSIGLREGGTERNAGNMAGQGGSSGGAFAGGHSAFSGGDGQGSWRQDQESNAGVSRIGDHTATLTRVMDGSIGAAPAAASGLRESAAYISVLA
ncbi:MAG TPA: hypothetical protein VL346_08280, partial [Acidobacteriaceae bacterium]|nr:hypothetical protein [Acidobacteriaceae bacterium]